VFAVRKYDVCNFFCDLAKRSIALIGSKQIDFELHIDENMPAHFYGYERCVKRVITNILANAIKFTEAGVVIMTVSSIVSVRNLDDARLVVSVSDTGKGITNDKASKLFSISPGAGRKTIRVTEGTGLKITSKLIYMMGGNITVKSEPGKGSVFTVCIPQNRVDSKILGKEAVEKLQKFRSSYIKRNN